MSDRDRCLLLEDMLESALKIKQYTLNLNFDSFVQDSKTVDAVIRNFEIIGKAANRVDLDFRLKNPNMQWNRIRGFRNGIVHTYFGIDFDIVWSIIDENLDELIGQPQHLLDNN